MMALPTMTVGLARAAAIDAGTRHAQDHGREVWNEADFNAATAELERICAAYGLRDPWHGAGFGQPRIGDEP